MTAERPLTPTMRWLLAPIGALALVAGVYLAAIEIHSAIEGAALLPVAALAIVFAIVAVGGASVLRGSIRGRIKLREFRRKDR